MAAVCRADPGLVEAMTVEDPLRAPHAGQAVGVRAAAGTGRAWNGTQLFAGGRFWFGGRDLGCEVDQCPGQSQAAEELGFGFFGLWAG